MARPLGYGDALKLLGGDPPTLQALDRALGGALGLLTGGMSGVVLNVFGAQDRILGLGRDLTGGLRDRLRGAGRVRRTHLLEAAHAVIVVTAYFEALADADLPFDVRELVLTGEDQARLALGAEGAARQLTGHLAGAPPRPAPHLPFETSVVDLKRWYRELSDRLIRFIAGLAVWDRLDEAAREGTRNALHALGEEAADRYEEYYSRLSADIPEFALWTTRIEHQATRAEARRALARVETLLGPLSAAVPPGAVADALATAYRAALARPILTEGDTPEGVRLPTLENGYFDPDVRIRAVGGDGRPADEDWWEAADARADLTDCLAGLLTSPEAQHAPLLVLGQPGAGKSVLTKVLAARLPTEAFLPVRVVLRGVPADGEIQDQIEYAIRDTTGEQVSWPALARSANGALPVILFDGFDELLQATGVSQSDYLERVARFQQREADQGRPVAAVVTSRTAVADRARCPKDMVAVRLEPFRQEQIDAWVAVWNQHNEALLAGRGLAPLPAEVVARQRALASQPLLLLMLALYDADSNALQRAGESLDVSELYEELLSSFARREVAKSAAGLPEAEADRLVERELQRLSLVAFGMVNRRRQWVTGAELDADLAALLGTGRAASTTTFRAPLTQADAALGRFFFIQRAQAVREGARLETYEFLHATFGEYLVARLAVGIAGEMLHQRPALALAPVSVDDGMLYALLSFAPLSSRQILGFVSGVCTRRFGLSEERSRLADLLIGVLAERAMRPEVPHPEYRPAALPVASRQGIYSANLVLLVIALAGRVTASHLFPEAEDPVDAWHRRVLLMRSSLTEQDWSDLGLALHVEHVWVEDRRELRVRLTGRVRAPAEPVDPYWHYRFPPGHPDRRRAALTWTRSHWDEVWHRMAVTGGTNDSMIRHALTPVHTWIGPAMAIYRGDAGSAGSLAHDLLELWLAGTLGASDDHLAGLYRRLGDFLGMLQRVDRETHEKAVTLVLGRLREDHPRLPAWLIAGVLMEALWLRGEGPVRDVLDIALAAGHPGVVLRAVQSLEALSDADDPLVVRARAFLDENPPPGGP